MENKKRRKVVVIFTIVFVWLALFITDLTKVSHFEKPIFCILLNGADDGGSGTYVGLGYTVEIEGDFVTEEAMARGVREFDMKLMGIRVLAGIRD